MKIVKQTKRSVFYIFILLLIFSCSEGNEIENSDIIVDENFVEISLAKEIAEDVYFENKTNSTNASKGSSDKSTKKTIENVNEVSNGIGKISFYVINYSEGGFILLSADKRIQPILGFSENGKFDIYENSYPPGLKFWIKDTKKQITDIQNSNIEQSEKNKLAWKEVQNALATTSQNIIAIEPPNECYEHTETITVGPLLNSTWHQFGDFNDALPYISCNGYDFQVSAGCVPIAMGQVMKYFQYPTNYNWTSMPLTSGTTTTANFIKDIHDAISNVYPDDPTYYCHGTGVSASANMGYVLKTQFNYSSANLANYNYYTVKNELNANRPVLLSGDPGTDEGHMWVCEGYKQTYFYFDDCTGGSFYPLFYMNWGWDGSHDGYYSYNNFNPGGTNYNNNKKMIYNIIH